MHRPLRGHADLLGWRTLAPTIGSWMRDSAPGLAHTCCGGGNVQKPRATQPRLVRTLRHLHDSFPSWCTAAEPLEIAMLPFSLACVLGRQDLFCRTLYECWVGASWSGLLQRQGCITIFANRYYPSCGLALPRARVQPDNIGLGAAVDHRPRSRALVDDLPRAGRHGECDHRIHACPPEGLQAHPGRDAHSIGLRHRLWPDARPEAARRIPFPMPFAADGLRV
jgi:hypothetical protein